MITNSTINRSKVGKSSRGETATVELQGPSCSGWRLPTEAEWEYAARGNQNYKYAGSNSTGEVAWYESDSDKKTHNVCQKLTNGFGLCDMTDNAFEWVGDTAREYSSRAETDPVGEKPLEHFLRGGSSYGSKNLAHVASRHGPMERSLRCFGIGFRLVRTIPD